MFKLFKKKKHNVVNQTIVSKDGYVFINRNGESIKVKGTNVSISNDKIYIDGKLYKSDFEPEKNTIYNITINGNVNKIESNGDVIVNGNANDFIEANGDVTINGDHKLGSISAGGDIVVDGNNTGNIFAGGDVIVKKNNEGNISSGGDVCIK